MCELDHVTIDKICSNTIQKNSIETKQSGKTQLPECCQYCGSQTSVFVQVNLMQYMKLSTSRDFRINTATLEAALQEQDDSQVSRTSCCN